MSKGFYNISLKYQSFRPLSFIEIYGIGITKFKLVAKTPLQFLIYLLNFPIQFNFWNLRL